MKRKKNLAFSFLSFFPQISKIIPARPKGWRGLDFLKYTPLYSVQKGLRFKNSFHFVSSYCTVQCTQNVYNMTKPIQTFAQNPCFQENMWQISKQVSFSNKIFFSQHFYPNLVINLQKINHIESFMSSCPPGSHNKRPKKERSQKFRNLKF